MTGGGRQEQAPSVSAREPATGLVREAGLPPLPHRHRRERLVQDGVHFFVWNLPWPNATSSGQHMWIQEDAWGNCSFFSS